MLTLYHSPMSRSTRITQLLRELNALDRVNVEIVTVTRIDGSGGIDPANPHPEGKVPLLVHDGVEIRESIAIAQYLAELFPEAGLSVPPGDPMRGPFLAWLAWYAGVLEPVVVLKVTGLEGEATRRTFRGMEEAGARLAEALKDKPYLCGDRYTVADLIVASTFNWMPAMTPDIPEVKAWVERCHSRPAMVATMAAERELLAKAA